MSRSRLGHTEVKRDWAKQEGKAKRRMGFWLPKGSQLCPRFPNIGSVMGINDCLEGGCSKLIKKSQKARGTRNILRCTGMLVQVHGSQHQENAVTLLRGQDKTVSAQCDDAPAPQRPRPCSWVGRRCAAKRICRILDSVIYSGQLVTAIYNIKTVQRNKQSLWPADAPAPQHPREPEGAPGKIVLVSLSLSLSLYIYIYIHM